MHFHREIFTKLTLVQDISIIGFCDDSDPYEGFDLIIPSYSPSYIPVINKGGFVLQKTMGLDSKRFLGVWMPCP